MDPEDDERFKEIWSGYYELRSRESVTPDIARAMIRKHNTLIGAMLLPGDTMLCGVASRYNKHL